MGNLTSDTHPEYHARYVALGFRINDFIASNQVELVEMFKIRGVEKDFILPIALPDILLTEDVKLASISKSLGSGDYTIKVNPNVLQDLSPDAFEAVMAHELGHMFMQLNHISAADAAYFMAFDNETIRRYECEADHFSSFFSTNAPHGRIEVFDKLESGELKLGKPDLLEATIRAVTRTHPEIENRRMLAEDPSARAFLPGTLLFNDDCTYDQVSAPPINWDIPGGPAHAPKSPSY